MNYPIYIAQINSDEQGIESISLVEQPAIQTFLQQFSEQEKKTIQEFSIVDEKSHKIISPIMRCDFPIYRNDNGQEYYLIFQKNTIEKMAEKMLTDGVQNHFNYEHNDENELNCFKMCELFIKNTEKGINPKGFEDIEEGSLFGVYQVNNDYVWKNLIENKKVGLSLTGFFDLVKKPTKTEMSENEKIEDEILEILDMLEKQKK